MKTTNPYISKYFITSYVDVCFHILYIMKIPPVIYHNTYVTNKTKFTISKYYLKQN